MGEMSLQQAIVAHRAMLWAVCYRMCGCAADADDLVQDTCERALERPPSDLTRPLRPWLVRVAMNLCRDHLRRRRRQPYQGPWLPGPAVVEAGPLAELVTPAARYGELESVTEAFLVALELLTPSQRAVLILRDVLGYSVRETAQALALGEPNVKTTHHRARGLMADYDRGRNVLSPERLRLHRSALQALLGHLATRNVDGLQALLSEDVRAYNDGAGKYFAARRVVAGRDKVILFHLKVNALDHRRGGSPARYAIMDLNGEPAMLAHWPSRHPRVAERIVFRIRLDARGRICRMDTVVADRKVSHLNFQDLPRLPPAGQMLQTLRATLAHPPLQQWAPAAAARAVRATGAYVRRRLVQQRR